MLLQNISRACHFLAEFPGIARFRSFIDNKNSQCEVYEYTSQSSADTEPRTRMLAELLIKFMTEGERKIENFVFEILIDHLNCQLCIFLECLSSVMDTKGFSGKYIVHLFLRFVCKIFHHGTIESFELYTILLRF